MRILLTSGASYAPPKGGSTRSNLAWLRELAGRGHTCRVVCTGEEGEIHSSGIAISRVPDLPLHAECLTQQIRAFRPDWVLVSSEDVTHRLLRAAERGAPGRIVYLGHTPQFFPFGAESWNRDREATRIVERAAGVVAIGNHMAGYIRKHSAAHAIVIHPPIYGSPPFTQLDPNDAKLVLMINPCVVKGIDIFIELARRMPDSRFGALAGWGTTSADREALASLPNVTVLPSVGDIEEVLRRGRVLLMPSLWYEGFGLIVMEAMLRGLPVIASDSGGLMEAKEGTGYVIPVRPIERYEPVFDESHMPLAVRPSQNVELWEEAVRLLLTDREAHRRETVKSREAAGKFVSALRPEAFEEYLIALKPRFTDAQRQLLLRRLGP